MQDSVQENRFHHHPLITGVIITIVVIVIAICLIEFVLGKSRPPDRPLLDKVAPQRHVQLREYSPNTRHYFEAMAVRKNAPVAPNPTYLVVTDSDGCIRPSNLHDEPDVSIVFLGGSTTEGVLIEAGKRWPERTVALIEEDVGININGCNAGRSGANVMHSTIKLLTAFMPQSIDIAVLMHGINDMGLLTRLKTYWPSDDWHFGQVRTEEFSIDRGIKILRNTLVPNIYEAIREPGGSADVAIGNLKLSFPLREVHALPLQMPLPEIPSVRGGGASARLEAFGRAVIAFVRMAKAWGIEPVLVTQYLEAQPSSKSLGGFLDPQQLGRLGLNAQSVGREHDLFNATLRSVARSEGALVVDIASIFADTKKRKRLEDHSFTYDSMHYHERGAAEAAKHMAASLRQPVLQIVAERILTEGMDDTQETFR